jgi:hypothetical protein
MEAQTPGPKAEPTEFNVIIEAVDTPERRARAIRRLEFLAQLRRARAGEPSVTLTIDHPEFEATADELEPIIVPARFEGDPGLHPGLCCVGLSALRNKPVQRVDPVRRPEGPTQHSPG